MQLERGLARHGTSMSSRELQSGLLAATHGKRNYKITLRNAEIIKIIILRSQKSKRGIPSLI